MKNIETWKETKFKKDNKGRFIGTHMHRAMGPKYEYWIKSISKGDLLDLGCGEVPLYVFYKDRVESVTCIDWSDSGHDLRHIDFAFDLNEPISLSEKSFDTIICTDVLEHIAKPLILMNEISRLLKEKGKVIIGVPFYYCLHEEPHDYYRYTKYALKRFCEKSNLKIVSIEEYGGAPEIMVDLIYKTWDFLNLPFRKQFLKNWNRLSRFFLSRKISKKISEKSA